MHFVPEYYAKRSRGSLHTLCPEVLDVLNHCTNGNGFDSSFVSGDYLQTRTPLMSMHAIDRNCCMHPQAG